MRITIDTDKGIFIVPKTFRGTLEKQNEILKKAGVSDDKLITERKFIEEAVNEAFKNMEEETQEVMGDITGGLGGGLPF